MALDSKLSRLLSDFFLDIAKAYFIAAFITPSITNTPTGFEAFLVLTRGLLNVILFLIVSWKFAKLEKK